MHRRGIVAMVVGCAAALALAACGSSGGGSPNASGSSGSGGGSTAASGTPIVIGNVGSYSGAQASSEAGAQKVINAWAQWVNAKGGINGHPVRLIVKDDTQTAAGALAAVKQLVENDHVVAIVAEQSNFDQTFAKYVQDKGIPVVGGLPVNLTFSTNPDFFTSGQNTFAMIYHELTLAKAIGPNFAYLYCAESPLCAQSVPLVQGLSKAAGVNLVLTTKVSGTATDYTAVCQELKNKKADSYQIGSGSAVAIRVAQACAAQGVTAKVVATDGTLTTAYKGIAAFNGMRSAENSFPWFDGSTPATKEYQDAIAKYVPDLGSQNGPNSSYAWVAGKLFEKAVSNIPSGTTITSDSIKQGLYAMKDETLGGLIGPVTFTQNATGAPGLINCGFTIGFENGDFTTPDGLKTTCAPDAIVQGILKSLG